MQNKTYPLGLINISIENDPFPFLPLTHELYNRRRQQDRPDNNEMEQAWNQGDISRVRQVAHDMKTSISVMGLNEKLDPLLDQLEYNAMDENHFQEIFSQLQITCNAALEEARHFYQS